MRSCTAPSISGQETSRNVDWLVNIIIIMKHKTEPPASLHNMKSDSKSDSYFLLLFIFWVSDSHNFKNMVIRFFFPKLQKYAHGKKDNNTKKKKEEEANILLSPHLIL